MSRVAVDVSVLDLPWPTGVQRGLLQLLRGLREEPDAPETVLLAPRSPRHLPADLARELPGVFLGGRLPPPVWRQVVAPRLSRRLGIDLWHSPVQALPLGLRRPRVATLHELSWRVAAGTGDEGARWRRRLATAAKVAAADGILAVSRHSRDRLLELHPGARVRCQVVPHGVDPRFAAARPDPETLARRYRLPPPPWLLVLGRALARKGLPRAIRAAAALRKRQPGPWTLVLAGPPTPARDAALALVEELGLAGRVRAPGWIAEEDLPALHATAGVLLVPSRSEGFGLPVLEAMAAGTPVVASRDGALPEVAGAAALLVDFDRPAAVAAALQAALGPERARLQAAGRRQAACFPIRRWVRGHLELWRSLLAAGSRP